MVGELHKAEAFAPLARELEAARDHLDTAKQLEEAEANSQKERTKSLWMVQAKPLMASFFEWFEPRAEGFPRIVNQNLILHMELTGKCICGHDLTADEIEAVKAMVGEGDDQASRRLTHLFDTAREWDGNADQVRVAFEEGLADMAAKQEAVSAAKDRLREAEEAIAGAGKGPQDLDALRASVVAHSRAKSELDGQITICEGLLATKNAERADLMRGAMADASDDLKLAHGKELAIGQVVELATSMRDAHADLCRPKLEECMNENYWVMKASRKILVDDNWLVDTYDEVGEDEFPIGGGGAETTLLTYAFAAATAKMIPAFRGSGVLNEIPDATDMAEAETYPLVVDAPFSSLGRTYQTRVAEKLPKSVHQLILFNESTHLKHFKSMKEKGLIGKLYAVVFTGELKGVAEDEKSFEFAGHEITYVIDETDNELSGSKMQEFAIGQ
jgi:DNA sulfur modification protein DndD